MHLLLSFALAHRWWLKRDAELAFFPTHWFLKMFIFTSAGSVASVAFLFRLIKSPLTDAQTRASLAMVGTVLTSMIHFACAGAITFFGGALDNSADMNHLLCKGRMSWECTELIKWLSTVCHALCFDMSGMLLKESIFLCLMVSGSINLLSVFAPDIFYSNFVCYQGLFFVAELAPCMIYQICTMLEIEEP